MSHLITRLCGGKQKETGLREREKERNKLERTNLGGGERESNEAHMSEEGRKKKRKRQEGTNIERGRSAG